ncbi:MAG: leucine-rich repeat protein [Clostridia bacterium]|nr:leucine-rich repeat protein [Clostridia bacterium]
MLQNQEILEQLKTIEERLDRIEKALGISQPQIKEALNDIAEEIVDSLESENTTHESGNYTYSDVDASSVQIDYYSWDGRRSIFIPSQIEGKTVVGISDEAFIRLDMKQVIFPPTLKYIGDRAFKECKKIEAIEFPKGLKCLGEEAFMGCYLLKRVTFPSTMEKIGKFCFAGDHFICEISLPIVKEIPHGCFVGCGRLEKITIPEGVEIIGNSAFSSCKLDQVELPKSLKELGFEVFTRNPSYEKIDLIVLGKETEIAGFKYNQSMTVYCLPGSKAEKAARKTGGTVECRTLV